MADFRFGIVLFALLLLAWAIDAALEAEAGTEAGEEKIADGEADRAQTAFREAALELSATHISLPSPPPPETNPPPAKSSPPSSRTAGTAGTAAGNSGAEETSFAAGDWEDWSRDDTARLVEKWGLPSIFVQIAGKESEHNVYAKGSTDDHGLFQIHAPTWLPALCRLGIAYTREELYDPDTNAAAAALIYDGGKGNGVGHWMVCAESTAGGSLDCE